MALLLSSCYGIYTIDHESGILMVEYPEFSEGEGLLRGAKRIARFLFGTEDKWREVYPMVPELPMFMLAGKLTARPSSLARAITERERTSMRKSEGCIFRGAAQRAVSDQERKPQ